MGWMGATGPDPDFRPRTVRSPEYTAHKFESVTTETGLVVLKFVDPLGHLCTVQKSTHPDKDLLWFGLDGTRAGAYLSREIITCLLPRIERFAETGDLK
jgi:hypothetical protein